MGDKKKVSLSRCNCGEPNPLLVMLRTGKWICACRGCPTHVYGVSEEDAVKNWEQEVRPSGRSGKGN